MKMGPIDGKVEEVRDLLENHGLNLADYLEKPPAPLKTRYLTIPSILFATSLCLFTLLSQQLSPPVTNLFYIASFGSGTWLTVSIQLRFKNALGTFCIAIGAILLILLATSILSPKDTADFIKGFKN